MVNFGLLAAEIGSLVWDTPANFNGFRVLPSITAETSFNGAYGGQQKSARCLAASYTGRALHYMYICGGCCPSRNFSRCKIHFASKSCVLLYLTALMHGTRSAAVSETLWRGTRNGIMELSQMATPIFGWAAITFSILVMKYSIDK